MPEAKSSFTKRLFHGIGTLYRLFRKVVLNLVFIVFVLILGGALISGGGDNEITVPKNSALVLKLSGNLVEQKRPVNPMQEFLQEVNDAPQNNPEVLLSDVVHVIENAKLDKRISALVLDLSGLGNAGLNKLNEVGRALESFKESEKPIIALGDYYTQNQYFLASYADKIYMHPMGAVVLEGYGRYRLYYRDAIEKLKASAHIFRVGTFKSAIEPYIRDDMSDAAKEANHQWLSALWNQYKTSVAARRGMEIDNFDETFDQLYNKMSASGGDWAQYAVENGWVDELKDREGIRQAMGELVEKSDNSRGYKYISFKKYLKVITTLPFSNPDTDKVAIVIAKGTIMDGKKKAGDIGGDSTAALLRKARKDDKVKAVVLRVDSPGGSAFASEVIRNEIEQLKAAGKPVVASMSTYAASGGYWISASADEIWAAPSTITGSIGIFGMFLTFENSLKALGITNDGVGTTDMAGFGTTRALPGRLGDVFQLSIERGYHKFINLVATERNMAVEDVDKIAQGRVWIGQAALELGLVDKLGNLQDAVASAAAMAELEKYDTQIVEKSLSPKEQLLKELFGAATAMVKTDTVNEQPSDLMKMVKTLIQQIDSTSKLNDPMGLHAYCLACEL